MRRAPISTLAVKMATRTLRSRVVEADVPVRPKSSRATAKVSKQHQGQPEEQSQAKRKNGEESAVKPKKVRLQPPKEAGSESSAAPLDEESAIRTPKKGAVKYDATASAVKNRPAEPHRTNAPLVTPKGSRIVAYKKDDIGKSPSSLGLPRPTTTTGNILEEACAHLIKMDSRMKPLIDSHYCTVFCPEGLAEECDPFKSLASGIMAQQISGAAAASVKRKFIGLFQDQSDANSSLEDSRFPSPAQVAACSVPFLSQAGLSARKAEYIQGLAAKFASGELSAEMLINASDEEVLEKLTAVRGLGRWSVEMFACFGLKRMDVLSTGDLGVQ